MEDAEILKYIANIEGEIRDVYSSLNHLYESVMELYRLRGKPERRWSAFMGALEQLKKRATENHEKTSVLSKRVQEAEAQLGYIEAHTDPTVTFLPPENAATLRKMVNLLKQLSGNELVDKEPEGMVILAKCPGVKGLKDLILWARKIVEEDYFKQLEVI